MTRLAPCKAEPTGSLREDLREAIPPLHHRDSVFLQIIIETDLMELGWMIER